MSTISLKALTAAAALGLSLTAGAPALADDHAAGTVVETAIAAPDFETLVAAVKAADLVETLSGEGPFTVFAPTDAAFAKLPDGTVASLLEPEAKDQLTGVLTYHVVPGAVSSEALVALIQSGGGQASVGTVSGDVLIAEIQDGGVILRDETGQTVNVTATDVAATNGVIHVIDTVLLPEG